MFWGLGNHGGGPSEKDLIDIARFQAQGKPWLHSTPERFFSECVPENVWEHPLTHVFPGCYSALARIKKIHAQLENDLYITEALCSYAALNEICDYPSTETELAQKDLLQIEFHDVLAGTCTKTCEMASIDTAAHGREILKRVFDKTFFALVNGEPRAKRDEYPLFVFNPLPYETKACVQSEFTLNPSNDGENDDSFVYAYGQNGVLLPCQVVKEESNLNWDCRKKIAILASLAPMSVTRISLFSEKTIKKKRQLSVLPFLGNEYFAEINPQSGKLEKYVVQGKELFTDGVGLVLYDDTPDPWAMGEKQQKKLGENPESFDFTPVPMATFKNEKGCRLIESGKVYNKIESFFQKENIFARIVYTLYRDLPYIDLEVNILFNACDKAVKLAFPLSFCGEFFGQTSFGREHLESDGRECCAQRFTMLKRSDGYAFILLNRSSYAFSYENGILFTTLLRGATYCAHPIGNRKLIPDDRYSEKTDQGEHIFSFRLIYDRAERAEMHANEFCHLPYALNIFPAERGPRADKFSLELSSPEITLSSFRKRKDGYLIRLFNPADEKKNVRIKCGRGGVNATFSAFEVKTFAYKKGILRERESMLPEIDFTKGTRRKND